MRASRVLRAAVLISTTCLFAEAAGSARDLTFEGRVTAQEALERVYYAHQIGAHR